MFSRFILSKQISISSNQLKFLKFRSSYLPRGLCTHADNGEDSLLCQIIRWKFTAMSGLSQASSEFLPRSSQLFEEKINRFGLFIRWSLVRLPFRGLNSLPFPCPRPAINSVLLQFGDVADRQGIEKKISADLPECFLFRELPGREWDPRSVRSRKKWNTSWITECCRAAAEILERKGKIYRKT